MKKGLLIALMAIVSVTYAAAQPRAIGGRLGYGAEFSYQHGLGNNMLQVEAGVPFFRAIEAVVTYDWINPFGADFSSVWDKKGEWNWYMGVGAGGGAGFEFKSGYVGVVGRVGVEYNFWFPLQLSVDFRPMLGVGLAKDYAAFAYDVYGGAIGLGVRYKF